MRTLVMPTLRDSDVLHRHPGHELVPVADGLMLARAHDRGRLFALCEGDLSALGAVLDQVDGQRTVAAIADRLAGTLPASAVTALLSELHDAGWLRLQPPDLPPRPCVRVLGDGALARMIAGHIARTGAARCEQLTAAPAHGLDGIGDGAALLVCALEGVPYRAVLAVEDACRGGNAPCIFASVEGARIVVGPTMLPGRDVGFAWLRHEALADELELDQRERGLQKLTVGRVDEHEPGVIDLLERAALEVALEVTRLLAPDQSPELYATWLDVRADETLRLPFSAPDPPSTIINDLTVAVDVGLTRRAVLSPRSREPMPSSIRSVGIIGGGTAGYLTALALRRKLPDLDVTVVESSRLGVIGVGESTTAKLVHFLHHTLGLDVVDFYRAVAPTWKLGIRFEWGLPGDYYYNSPFQFGKLLPALTYDNDLDRSCLAARLMADNHAHVLRLPSGAIRPLLTEVPYAYHLDNRRFIACLQDHASRAGVTRLDAVVREVVVTPDREAVDHLITEDGRELRFDLFVDCTGFRSLLLGEALGSPYHSYDSSLYTDRAIVADVPHGGRIRPYTTATTMDAGWCWNIPMHDEDHRGYVYSSAFLGEDEAVAEMRAKNPGMSEPRTIKFRTGRREQFWRGNVVAIGNSYAFVEPLQSTAIHMAIVAIEKLLESFPGEPGLRAFQPVVNRELAGVWDHLRWFLAAHYRYNHRQGTPFWQACRAEADISGIADYVALYQEKAPIGSHSPRFPELDDSTFGVYRHDLLFMGQGMATRAYCEPAEDRETWRRITAAIDRVAAHALDQREAHAALLREPELLRAHIRQIAGT